MQCVCTCPEPEQREASFKKLTVAVFISGFCSRWGECSYGAKILGGMGKPICVGDKSNLENISAPPPYSGVGTTGVPGAGTSL